MAGIVLYVMTKRLVQPIKAIIRKLNTLFWWILTADSKGNRPEKRRTETGNFRRREKGADCFLELSSVFWYSSDLEGIAASFIDATILKKEYFLIE
jgi:hypothetical protein